jgi:hypothetical protein
MKSCQDEDKFFSLSLSQIQNFSPLQTLRDSDRWMNVHG